MRVFVYLFDPVESWPGWMLEHDFHRQLHDLDHGTASHASYWTRYECLRDRGLGAAERLGWFGDYMSGPHIAGLPMPAACGDVNVMVAWRRGMDGQTLVVSPAELPWLRDDPRCAWVCDEQPDRETSA